MDNSQSSPLDLTQDEGGLTKIFKDNQLKSLERRKKTVETAHLLKDIMNHKELLRRNETETDKLLSVMAAKTNDSRIERSMNDYQNLV